MKNDKHLEMSNLAQQTLTYFDVRNAIRKHFGGKQDISSYYSHRAGKFHVVTDEKTITIVLASESEVLTDEE